MIKIRNAVPEDAEVLLEIYSPYITDTAITFEYDVPSLEEFRERIIHISSRYPYMVAEDENGLIVGYCYAACFKNRAAYDWAVETTIYIRKGHHREGIGRLLYEELELRLLGMGITNLNACIAVTDVEDEYLTNDSMRFHSRLGYATTGTFHKIGYKFGRWYNMIWMEKLIGDHLDDQPPVRFGPCKP